MGPVPLTIRLCPPRRWRALRAGPVAAVSLSAPHAASTRRLSAAAGPASAASWFGVRGAASAQGPLASSGVRRAFFSGVWRLCGSRADVLFTLHSELRSGPSACPRAPCCGTGPVRPTPVPFSPRLYQVDLEIPSAVHGLSRDAVFAARYASRPCPPAATRFPRRLAFPRSLRRSGGMICSRSRASAILRSMPSISAMRAPE